MKLKNLKYLFFVSIILSTAFMGCLKDTSYNDHQSESTRPLGVQNVVYVGLTATSNDNHLQLAFAKSDADTTFDAVPIILSGGGPAPEDIQVTLIINTALLGNYNAANGTTHEEMPTSLYTSSNAGDSATGYVVTIPKGQSTGYLSLKVIPNNFLGVDYALGLQISSVSSGYLISTNFNTGILAIATKNQWDGVYTFTQKTTGWAAYSIADGQTFTLPSNVSLVTATATADDFRSGYGTYQLGFDPNGGVVTFGATAPRFIFDPSTNALVDVVNTAPDDGRGRAFHINPSVTDSRYDPVTKIIYASYIFAQNGRPDQYVYDTLTYVKSR
ncbi:MAG: DUF1735 domain-containing protein [Parafilimonas sp.]